MLVLGDAVRLIWGREENSVSVPPELAGIVRPFGVSFPVYRIALIGVGIAICIALWALLYRTRWGMLVRAATVDREMLQALGIPTYDACSRKCSGLGQALPASPAASLRRSCRSAQDCMPKS